MSTDRRQLEYAPVAPVRRRRRVWRAMTALFILVIAWVGWRYAPGYVLRARQMYWQRQCMSFEPPPGAVVYDHLPAEQKPVVAEPFTDWIAPQLRAAPPVMKVLRAQRLNGSKPPVLVALGPTCLLRLEQAMGKGGWREGAIVFCHERTGPSGNRRLVTVLLPTFSGTDGILGDMLAAELVPTVYPMVGVFGPPLQAQPQQGLMAHSGPTLPAPQRVWAGVADPGDASHFTIDYEWPGGLRGVIDGWLRDDDTVQLSIRPGPGDVQSAFRAGVHLR